jgi:hypothetical protein
MDFDELLQEHRRRVQEAVSVIEKAVQANRRVYEIECEAEELMTPGNARCGCQLYSACWPLLNEECFDDWLHYLRHNGFLDDFKVNDIRDRTG